MHLFGAILTDLETWVWHSRQKLTAGVESPEVVFAFPHTDSRSPVARPNYPLDLGS